MDFFVVSDDNFRTTRNALSAVIPVTPLVEQPPRAHPGVD